MAPTRPVPTEQQVAFELAVAERLGIDPETAVLKTWRVDGGGDSWPKAQGFITLDHLIDGDELLEMFNTGKVPEGRTTALDVLAEMERHAPLPNPGAFYAIKLREALGVTGPLACSCGSCEKAGD